MRINHPVTQREYHFPEGDTLVSTTDLKGRITYCNPAFVEVSGYERAELIGKPHNLIRHPDMPPEAFGDMWATIASGIPWSGLVKNRRKNGDHYWVQANVTPLLDQQGRPTGYMSVRTCPDRTSVQAAEALYERLNQARQTGQRAPVRLKSGAVEHMDPLSRLGRLLRPGIRGRIGWASGLVGSIGFLMGEFLSDGLSHIELSEVLAGGGVVGACAALGAWMLQGQVTRPVTALVEVANQMAGGDLTQQVRMQRRHDEVGQLARSLTQLNVNLMSIVRDARNGVVQMSEGTEAIAAGNQDLSARTEAQASNLQETAASMEQITATIRQTTQMAGQATDRAGEARQVTERSSGAVQALTQTMHSISTASSRISEIIQVVDGIAFQTNILALNAAVEAARAGEQGRGFAVVAGEVRALAQRTSVAAREIRGLIQASVEQVAEGSQQTEQASRAMSDVQQAVNEVHHIIQQISHGLGEQMQGVSQVNQAVSDLDSITQQNAALVEQVAASASSLSQQAREVEASVGVFRLPGLSAQRGAAPSGPVEPVRKQLPAPKAAAASRPVAVARPAPAPAPAAAAPMATAGNDSEWTAF